MMNNTLLFSACLLAGLTIALVIRPAGGDMPAPAPEKHAEHKATPTGTLLDLGNAECPVMGGEVDHETYLEWNGLRVGFCCAGCDKRFSKNPEKHLDKTGLDWRAAVEAARAYRAADAKGKAEIERRWKVVRE